MRIISDFHDYYDASQSLGHDPTVIYLRKKKEILIEDFPFPTLRYYKHTWHYRSWDRDIYRIEPYIIGLCGKIYAVIEMTVNKYPVGEAIEYCYSIEEVDAFIEEHCRKKDIDKFRKNKWKARVSIRDDFKKFFDEVEEKREDFGNIFVEHGVPIFVALDGNMGYFRYNSRNKSILNANEQLKRFKFVRIFDVYTAFQEIEMYLTNIAVPAKEMPKVPDVLNAESHGFDKKYSFRKDPSKKK